MVWTANDTAYRLPPTADLLLHVDDTTHQQAQRAGRWYRLQPIDVRWHNASDHLRAVHDFHRLDVWHLSRALGSDIFRICSRKTQPDSRAITGQLRRSALSIATNIAEGCGKSSRAETIRFLEIAAGSAAETEHHLLVAQETEILPHEVTNPLLARVVSVRRMLFALIKHFPQP